MAERELPGKKESFLKRNYKRIVAGLAALLAAGGLWLGFRENTKDLNQAIPVFPENTNTNNDGIETSDPRGGGRTAVEKPQEEEIVEYKVQKTTEGVVLNISSTDFYLKNRFLLERNEQGKLTLKIIPIIIQDRQILIGLLNDNPLTPLFDIISNQPNYMGNLPQHRNNANVQRLVGLARDKNAQIKSDPAGAIKEAQSLELRAFRDDGRSPRNDLGSMFIGSNKTEDLEAGILTIELPDGIDYIAINSSLSQRDIDWVKNLQEVPKQLNEEIKRLFDNAPPYFRTIKEEYESRKDEDGGKYQFTGAMKRLFALSGEEQLRAAFARALQENDFQAAEYIMENMDVPVVTQDIGNVVTEKLVNAIWSFGKQEISGIEFTTSIPDVLGQLTAHSINTIDALRTTAEAWEKSGDDRQQKGAGVLRALLEALDSDEQLKALIELTNTQKNYLFKIAEHDEEIPKQVESDNLDYQTILVRLQERPKQREQEDIILSEKDFEFLVKYKAEIFSWVDNTDPIFNFKNSLSMLEDGNNMALYGDNALSQYINMNDKIFRFSVKTEDIDENNRQIAAVTGFMQSMGKEVLVLGAINLEVAPGTIMEAPLELRIILFGALDPDVNQFTGLPHEPKKGINLMPVPSVGVLLDSAVQPDFFPERIAGFPNVATDSEKVKTEFVKIPDVNIIGIEIFGVEVSTKVPKERSTPGTQGSEIETRNVPERVRGGQ